MKLEQHIGPFFAGQVIFNKSNVEYLQLGIECPHSIPLSELEIDSEEDWPIVVSINSNNSNSITEKDFVLTTNDILEFNRLKLQTITIKIKRNIDNPYLIINAAYEDAT